ncbi:protein farnesyltransferase subunit beta-like [Sycon ciliatum]|uniref:protein farnesyltransferase subunit beta-like n=1 Tax=Sycon ciliatum TaxID=27933 RepID=UPI0031F6F79F
MALISHLSLDQLACNDDLWPTDTSVSQEEVDSLVAECYDCFKPGSSLASGALEPYYDETQAEAEATSGSAEPMADIAEGIVKSCDAADDVEGVQAVISAQLDEEGYEATVLPNDTESDSDDGIPVKPSSVSGLVLDRDQHLKFLRNGLHQLPTAFQRLDANRPWLCYYIVHSLCLLDAELEAEEKSHVVEFLRHCQSPNGGFAGGPGQLSHIATTYAAVLTLASLGTREAYEVVDRAAMRRFLLALASESGEVRVHDGGEADVRAAYCACSVAHILNLDVWRAYGNVAFWLSECQTYEGGFGGVRGAEAHGGYTYCAFAALCLLRHATDYADLEALAAFVSRRQMRLEGGFQGRTNKLVDACYSYWMGALFPLLRRALILAASTANEDDDEEDVDVEQDFELRAELPADVAEPLLCCPASLQSYLLTCCQYPGGGLVDKPGKRPDFYHTCYALSGLSIAQNCAAAVYQPAAGVTMTTSEAAAPAEVAALTAATSTVQTTSDDRPGMRNQDDSAELAEEVCGVTATLDATRISAPDPSSSDCADDSLPESSCADAKDARGDHVPCDGGVFVLGHVDNQLVSVDPLLNICTDKAERALAYFRSQEKL